MRRAPAAVTVAASLALLAGLPAAPAAAQGPACVVAGALPAARPAVPLRFGITGQAAGSAGVSQGQPAPEDPARALAALDGLRRPHRDLVLRLNRMFQADGAEGIRRFEALTDTYLARGYKVELQVRYHPPQSENGDIRAYVRYVRQAVKAFAPRRGVIALSITNEPNLVASPNTSDGFYRNSVDALVQGIKAAREEADRLGRPDLQLGFTYAYRFLADESFFSDIGTKGDAAFRDALDYVGLQAYPGLFYPPPGLGDPAQQAVDAANLLRTCLFPRARIGGRTKIWVTENGYASRRGDDPQIQRARLVATLDALHDVSGTLGLTDYRYFNLRDNRSTGSDLFDAVGLLYDDYVPKPAYAAYQQAIDRLGVTAPAPRCASARLVVRPRLRGGERVRRVHARVTGGRVVELRPRPGGRTIGLRVIGRRPDRAARVVLHVRTTRGRQLTIVRRVAACG